MTDDADRASFRRGLGVPDAVASCHTGIADGYALEGHVPAEAIVKLLAERPTAVGLALPEMPADAPGMGGDATSWATQPVVLVAADGALSAYAF